MDEIGVAEHEGVRIEYEVRGMEGATNVLLLPAWALVDRQVWRPAMDRLVSRARVIAFDGAGNGGSDRSTDPAAYAHEAVVGQALAVLEATETRDFVGVAASAGTGWLLGLADRAADRMLGAVFMATPLPLTPPAPGRAAIAASFYEPAPEPASGWERFNADYWQRDYPGFVDFFLSECLPEPDSEAVHALCSSLALQTTPEVLLADMAADNPDPEEYERLARRIRCPVLVIHGDADGITPLSRSERLAELTGGELVVLHGVGHLPHARHPGRVGELLHDFLHRTSPEGEPSS